MKRTKRNKKKRIYFYIIGITIYLIFLVIVLFYLNRYIFYPSYLSVIAECNVNGQKIADDAGYITGGITTLNLETNLTTITIFHDNPEVKKHENIHRLQYLRWSKNGFIYGCESPRRLYFAEMEAYIGQYLPDYIYKRVYGNY